MRLIHTADLHLDSKMQTWLSEDEARARRDELLYNFSRLVDASKEMEAAGILIVGDLFDKNSVARKTENIVLETIIGNPEVNFYYVPGNHDDKCVLTQISDCPPNLFVFGEEIVTMPLDVNGRITLSGVQITENNWDSFYDDISLDKSSYNIFMLHGEERAGGSPAVEENLEFRLLQSRNIDYLAMGHVHAPKLSKLDARGVVVYPGCLEGRGFDECGDRGFCVLDIDEDTLTAQYSFVPFAQRTMRDIGVFCSGCNNTNDIANRIQSVLENTEFETGDFLKIRLLGVVDAFCDKDLGYLQLLFNEKASVVRIVDETDISVDYGDYAQDPGLKGEFVRLVSRSELDSEEKAEIIRMGINALMGEELL